MNDTLKEYLSYGSFVLPLMKVKQILKPIRVRWGSDGQHFLHYLSPNPKSKSLVIYIHGGGWRSGSPKDFHFIGQRIALEGYDCILPSYRKTPKYRYDQIIGDIFKGYIAIQKYLSKRGLEYSKIIVIGSSSGAHLGALLCYDTKLQRKFGINADKIDKFISLAGPLCFDLPQTGAANKLIGDLFSSRDLSDQRRGEPISKLKAGQKTSALLIHSKHDGILGFDQAEKFYKRAVDLGIQAELYTVTEPQNTHSAYSAAIFLKERSKSPTLNKLLDWLDS